MDNSLPFGAGWGESLGNAFNEVAMMNPAAQEFQDEWHEALLRVRYAETDKMGVVYHANYLIWFEIGRT